MLTLEATSTFQIIPFIRLVLLLACGFLEISAHGESARPNNRAADERVNLAKRQRERGAGQLLSFSGGGFINQISYR